MKFDYVRSEVPPLPGESAPQYVHEPIIPVRVIGPAGAWIIRGLLDTGAAETLIPMRFLEKLGIARGERFDLKGVSGVSFSAWLGIVDFA